MSDTAKKVPSLEEIELRAYEIYLKRGDADGVALEDWLAAERELLASRQTELSNPTLPLVKPATPDVRTTGFVEKLLHLVAIPSCATE